MRRMHGVLSVPFLFSHYKCRSFLHLDWFPVTLTNRINNVACCPVCPTWVKECEHIIKQKKKRCFVWRSSNCTVTRREWDPWTGIVWMTALIRVCPPLAKGKKIQCVILSFYTATTMDRSLLRLTPHLAEARGGQAPLVADVFNTACPKNNNQAPVNVEGA